MGSDAQGVAVPRPLHTTVASLEQSGKLPLAVIVEPLLNLGQQLMGPNERVALPFRPSPFPSDRGGRAFPGEHAFRTRRAGRRRAAPHKTVSCLAWGTIASHPAS